MDVSDGEGEITVLRHVGTSVLEIQGAKGGPKILVVCAREFLEAGLSLQQAISTPADVPGATSK